MEQNMNIVDVAPQRRQSGAMRADSKAVAVRDLGRFTLRLPEETLAAIDRLCAERPGAVSRNTWITEAVEEKLARDTTSEVSDDEAP